MVAYRNSTGIAHRNIRGQLYPIVGLGYPGVMVRVTLGLPAPAKPDNLESEMPIVSNLEIDG